MNRRFPLLTALLVLSGILITHAQSAAYRGLIKMAEAAYNEKHYDSSAMYYSAAFQVEDGKGTTDDRYNAACSWARIGRADSAFYNLFAITQLADFREYGHLMADADLESLHHYKTWEVLRQQVLTNVHNHRTASDTALADELEEVEIADQHYRMQLDDIQTKYGQGSAQTKALWDTINKYDAINLRRIKELLKEHGWMPRSLIGPRGVTTVFLVLQHADSATQVAYVPMMREALQKGELPKPDFALFEDRVLLRQGHKQLYGSQIQCRQDSCYVLPLEDPINVDVRRRSMGLGPLADYVLQWKISWEPTEFIKQQAKGTVRAKL